MPSSKSQDINDHLQKPIREFFGPQNRLSKKLKNYEYRQGQVEMANAVYTAMLSNQHLIIEAGTGTGKSLAYLIPGILTEKQLVISTVTKNLQEQLFYKDIPFIRDELGLSFSASTLKGRGNYLCLRRYQQFLRQPFFEFREEAALFNAISEWVGRTKTGERSELEVLPDRFFAWSDINSSVETCIGKKCQYRDDCYFEKAKLKARQSDVIIVNHHLLFADISLKRQSHYYGVLPDVSLLILDEAHEIEDVATNYFGISFSYWQVHRLIRESERFLTGEQFNESRSELVSLIRQLEDQSRYLFFTQLRGRTREKVRLRPNNWDISHQTAFKEMEKTYHLIDRVLTPLKSKSDDIENLIKRWKMIFKEASTITAFDRDDWVYWIETTERNTILAASPIDVSEELKSEIFKKIPSVILTSATLSTNNNFNFLKQRIGLEQCLERMVDSPFDYRRQAFFYVPPRAPDPRSERFDDFVINTVETIIRLTTGKAFILFTSWKRMEKTYEALADRLPVRSFLQGQKPRHVLIEEFKKDINSVLFATSSFWHGVDVAGRSLSCVIVDKIPFSVPNEPIIEARIEYIKKRGGNAFMEFMVPSAIITLKQGIGRLIRARTDYGLIALLDKRYIYSSYSHNFQSSMPPVTIIREDHLLKKVTQYIQEGKGFQHEFKRESQAEKT